MATITNLYRYPVKGLSAEPLESVTLCSDETFPFDRAYAIENGPSKFDLQAPKHLPKIAFLMLMRNKSLAALKTNFDDKSKTLTIRQDGEVVAEGNLETEAGRQAIETFFEAYSAPDLRGKPRILSVPGHAFTDVATKCVSLINLATLSEIEKHVDVPVHPLRFRANIYVNGLRPFEEFEWVGHHLKAGSVEFEAFARIARCEATNVNPDTATRDLAIPRTLLGAYGHPDCGIYLRVTAEGTLRTGDTMRVAGR